MNVKKYYEILFVNIYYKINIFVYESWFKIYVWLIKVYDFNVFDVGLIVVIIWD